LNSETGGSGATGEESTEEAVPAAGTSEGTTATTQPQGAETPAQTGPPVEGKRTQLKLVRENIQSLSKDVGSLGKSHEAGIKKLEKQVAALRSDLAAQSVSKDVGSFRKSHEASSKRLEKQVATLRSDVAALKIGIAKDSARARAKQEATLAKILTKVNAKPAKAAKPAKKPAKGAAKR
jgi:hypothetical protein